MWQSGKKNQILEAEGQIAISGSYFHCHVSLWMSFQLLAILASLFVKSFLSRVQWGIGTALTYGTNLPYRMQAECNFILVFYHFVSLIGLVVPSLHENLIDLMTLLFTSSQKYSVSSITQHLVCLISRALSFIHKQNFPLLYQDLVSIPRTWYREVPKTLSGSMIS